MSPKDKSSERDESAPVPQVVIAQAQAAAANNDLDPLALPAHTGVDNHPLGQNVIHQNENAEASGSSAPSAQPTANEERPIEQQPPPLFSNTYGQVDLSQDGFDTKAHVTNDGRLNIRINQKSRRLSDLLVPALRSQLNVQHVDQPAHHPPGYIPPSLSGLPGQKPPPPLNVVIHVVGSRGDVQPFVALGKVLKETFNHRVRLATHTTFKDFVEENGLEYFDIGGDPAELMAFMVKNPGLMPGMDSLKSGDVGKRRKGIYEILQGCWRSCFEIGNGSGAPATDENAESRTSLDSGISMDSNPSARPFVADAIIANPPSFAHIHIAEKLGIPLHLMFTMPWSPTQSFPHPLANIQSSNADTSLSNFLSYALVEMMTWQGLGDMINRFREKSLGLEPISLIWAPGVASRLRIPYTYCWSPSLIPKPKDWGNHISISGFYFLSLASNFTPEPALEEFLNAGPPPVYIGFGSIVVDDPNAMTKLIFDAVKKTGQRALVSKGWGGFGADALGIPDNVFMLGNVPHDWLFKRVSCVVHHGGAGTTAAGIALGRPTVVVPFFGDQPFWGAMIAKAGAGPKPVPSKQLTADNLAAEIMEALHPNSLSRAQELGARISSENGTLTGAQSFHDQLDMDTLRCSLAPSRNAVWRVKRTELRLSAFAATTLGNEGLLDFNDIKLYRPREYETETGPWDPISGGASALLGTACSLLMGVADFPVEALKALRIKPAEKSEGAASPASPITKPTSPSNVSLASTQTANNDENPNRRSSSLTLQNTLSSSDSITQEEGGTLSPSDSRSSQCAPRAMATALRGSLSRSSSGSRSRTGSPKRSSSETGHLRRSSSNHITADTVMGTGKGIGRMVGASVKSPMDFTLGIARGFHNAPKLYGDDKVRESDKITDFQSGLKAAGKEFGYGFYDGITGLVTQPIDGAKKEGFAGFIKGFGKGIGGVVLKPGAAIWGLPGYTFKGIYKEVQRHFGSSVQNYIIAARTTQGLQEWSSSNQEERLDVISRWQASQADLQKQRDRHKFFHDASSKAAHFGDRKKKKPSQAPSLKPEAASAGTSSPATPDVQSLHRADADEFEEAIQKSVAATSRGDPNEDQVIERAIRASVQELRSSTHPEDEETAMRRAIQASVAEAQRGGRSNQDLELALQQSLSHTSVPAGPDTSRESFEDSGIDTDDDEDVHKIIEKSKSDIGGQDSDDDLQKTIKMSQESHDAHLKELEKSRAEEEVVLNYVKKQSELEEAHRKKLSEKAEAGSPG